MAFKTFIDGNVLTETDLNDYLMRQSVIACTSGSRPSSPVEGMTIYETDTDLLLTYSGSAWVIMAGNRYYVRKPSDETVINSAALQDDDHLFLSVAANAVYELRLRLYINADSAGDFKCGWSVPAGTTMRWTAVDVRVGTTDGRLTESDVMPLVTTGPTTPQSQTIEGSVVTSSSAGTLRLRWAQNGAVAATSAVVQSHSVLQLDRIS